MNASTPLPPLSDGLSLAGPEFDQPEPSVAKRRYLILSPQRSGSNYLCRRLCNVQGRFGLPVEYLHESARKHLLQRMVPPELAGKLSLMDYLQHLQRIKSTPDGWFGTKLQPGQFWALAGQNPDRLIRFANSFDRLIVMTRRDKLGQAISGAIADATRVWFNTGGQHALKDIDQRALIPIIIRKLNRYADDDIVIQRVARASEVPVVRIVYEDLCADGDQALRDVVQLLVGDADIGALNEGDDFQVPEKPEGSLAQELRGLFLRYLQGEPL